MFFFFFSALTCEHCNLKALFSRVNAACSGGSLYASVCTSFTCMTICGISIKIFNRLELKKKKKKKEKEKQLWLCDCTHTDSVEEYIKTL